MMVGNAPGDCPRESMDPEKDETSSGSSAVKDIELLNTHE